MTGIAVGAWNLGEGCDLQVRVVPEGTPFVGPREEAGVIRTGTIAILGKELLCTQEDWDEWVREANSR